MAVPERQYEYRGVEKMQFDICVCIVSGTIRRSFLCPENPVFFGSTTPVIWGE